MGRRILANLGAALAVTGGLIGVWSVFGHGLTEVGEAFAGSALAWFGVWLARRSTRTPQPTTDHPATGQPVTHRPTTGQDTHRSPTGQ